MSEKMYFEKDLWRSVFGVTKYFNQKPWDVATNRKLLDETSGVIQILFSDFLNQKSPIEDFYYTIAMVFKYHRVIDNE